MATETATRENWLNVMIKVQACLRAMTTTETAHSKDNENRNDGRICASIPQKVRLVYVLSLPERALTSRIFEPN